MKKWLTFGEIYLTIQTNAFIYFIRKVPFLKHLVHSGWYSKYLLKHLFSIFGVIIGFIKDALGENIGILLTLYLLPSLIAPDFKMDNSDYFFLFLGVKCITSLLDSGYIFNSKTEDYTFLYHFMVNPKNYYLYKTLRQVFFSSVMLFPVLVFIMNDFYFVLAAICTKMMCELFGNVCFLFFYSKKKKLPPKRIRQVFTAFIAISFYVLLFMLQIPVIHFTQTALVLMSIGALVISYFSWNYHRYFSGYKEIAVSYGNQSVVSMRISVRSVGEDERGLVERPWEENKVFYKTFENLEPADYLHHAFWARFGKVIHKDIRAQCIAMCGLLALLGICIRMGWIPFDITRVLDYSPILLSFTMGFSIANRMTQMYFRNIDLHLMYNHMCTEKYVKDSMIKRYLHILCIDLVYIGVLLAGIVLFLLASGLTLGIVTMIQLLLVSGAFLILWDTYQLMLYYFVQPYTVDLTVKSPLFSFLQVFEALFGILILFVRRDLTLALPVVLGLTALGILACVLMSRFASGYFKLRF